MTDPRDETVTVTCHLMFITDDYAKRAGRFTTLVLQDRKLPPLKEFVIGANYVNATVYTQGVPSLLVTEQVQEILWRWHERVHQ